MRSLQSISATLQGFERHIPRLSYYRGAQGYSIYLAVA